MYLTVTEFNAILYLSHLESRRIMEIFTIGYTQKSANEFFSLILENNIEILLDIRLYNSSQLAGYTKSRDLQYFLKQICDCDYVYTPQFAPTKELLDGYKSEKITWSEYEIGYNNLIDTRNKLDIFNNYQGKRICLLCAEVTPDRCHRRLLAEKVVTAYENITVNHL